VCVCVCVSEREREKERARESGRERTLRANDGSTFSTDASSSSWMRVSGFALNV